MTDDLWDWADIAAAGYVAGIIGRPVAYVLHCAVNWHDAHENYLIALLSQFASAIRYGAEVAERDLLRNARYYSADATGIEEQEFLEEAASVAADNLDAARETAQRRGEWPDWVEPIEYGYLVPVAKATMVPVGDGGACDYRLEPVR